MSTTINLEHYFDRIGFRGTARPDLSTLQAIQKRHVLTIPFENLNPFTGRAVSLALDDIENKLVRQGRGGYCFEQNKLMASVLTQIGFKVKGLAARVFANRAIDQAGPATHQLLLIDLEDAQYLVDVGFGGMSPTGPLQLIADTPQSTPHEDYRLTRHGQYYHLEAEIQEHWQPLYKFQTEEHFDQDYEVMNWFTSCHPTSHFTHVLIAARAFEGGRYALRDTQFSTHRLGSSSLQKQLDEPAAVEALLTDIFGLDISGLSELQPRIAQLFTP